MSEINKILYNASIVILVLFPKLSKSFSASVFVLCKLLNVKLIFGIKTQWSVTGIKYT